MITINDPRNWLSISLLFFALGCGRHESPPATIQPSTTADASTSEANQTMAELTLTSNAIVDGQRIDDRYTVEGDDMSPPLRWSSLPAATRSLALICDDPDAPSPQRPAAEPWVHWVIFNIPVEATELPAGIARELEPAQVPGARQGKNSWPSNNIGYRGPAPPPGSGQHRYFFKLYALDKQLDLEAGASKSDLLEAMAGHVLAEGQLFGVYERTN